MPLLILYKPKSFTKPNLLYRKFSDHLCNKSSAQLCEICWKSIRNAPFINLQTVYGKTNNCLSEQ